MICDLAPMQHEFIRRDRVNSVILELIERTRRIVRELDNLNYRKMKKILMTDSFNLTKGEGGEEDPEDGVSDSVSESVSSRFVTQHSLFKIKTIELNESLAC